MNTAVPHRAAVFHLGRVPKCTGRNSLIESWGSDTEQTQAWSGSEPKQIDKFHQVFFIQKLHDALQALGGVLPFDRQAPK